MPPSVLTDLQREIIPQLQQAWDAHTGDGLAKASGVLRYYVERGRAGSLLSPYDPGAIASLRDVDPGARVWEIGAGLGQLGFMLAADGRKVMAVDISEERLGVLRATLEALRQRYPEVCSRITPVLGGLPDALGRADVAADVATVLGCPVEESLRGPFEQALHRFGTLLVDFRFYPAKTLEAADIARRCAAFRGYRSVHAYAYKPCPGLTGVPTVMLLQADAGRAARARRRQLRGGHPPVAAC